MKKNYYMRTFDPNIHLLGFAILNAILDVLLHFLEQVAHSAQLTQLTPYLDKGQLVLKTLGYCSFLLVFFLFAVELLARVAKDNLFNLFQSIWNTHRLRSFLTQRERSEKTIENQQVQSVNPIYASFNRAVRASVVDIRRDKVMVYIKMPKSQQAQKILNDMQSQIKEEISSRHEKYYFSTIERHKNQLWLVGTRRK